MGFTTTFELREKDVINVCTGQRLGRITELEIECDCGRIIAVTVTPDSFGAVLFSRCRIRIPWDKIVKIGSDAILVEAPPSPPDKDCCERRWWKR